MGNRQEQQGIGATSHPDSPDEGMIRVREGYKVMRGQGHPLILTSSGGIKDCEDEAAFTRDTFAFRIPSTLDASSSFTLRVGSLPSRLPKGTEDRISTYFRELLSARAGRVDSVSAHDIPAIFPGALRDMCQVSPSQVALVLPKSCGLWGVPVVNLESGELDGVMSLPSEGKCPGATQKSRYAVPRCCCAIPDPSRPLLITGGEEFIVWSVKDYSMVASDCAMIFQYFDLSFLPWLKAVAHVGYNEFYIHDVETAKVVLKVVPQLGNITACDSNELTHTVCTVGEKKVSLFDIRSREGFSLRGLIDGSRMSWRLCCVPEHRAILLSQPCDSDTTFKWYDERKLSGQPSSQFSIPNFICKQLERAEEDVFVARSDSPPSLVSFRSSGKVLARKERFRTVQRSMCCVDWDSWETSGELEALEERVGFLADQRNTAVVCLGSTSLQCWRSFVGNE